MISANVITRIEQEVIIQETEVIDSISGIARSFSQSVVNTQESQLRQALISLGWTPPPDPATHDWRCLSVGMYDTSHQCTKCHRKFITQVDADISLDDCPFLCEPPNDD